MPAATNKHHGPHGIYIHPGHDDQTVQRVCRNAHTFWDPQPDDWKRTTNIQLENVIGLANRRNHCGVYNRQLPDLDHVEYWQAGNHKLLVSHCGACYQHASIGISRWLRALESRNPITLIACPPQYSWYDPRTTNLTIIGWSTATERLILPEPHQAIFFDVPARVGRQHQCDPRTREQRLADFLNNAHYLPICHPSRAEYHTQNLCERDDNRAIRCNLRED